MKGDPLVQILEAAGGYDPSAYGRDIADEYDALYESIPDTDEAVACLAELAGDGPVLELGIGTGRLALPLAERGLEVHGVEASEEMVTQLTAKPGGDEIPVEVASFDDYELDRRFSLIVLALHTIYGLPTPEHQVRCFTTAARHLLPGGALVIEASLLDVGSFRAGQAVRPRFSSDGRVELQIHRYDPVSQRLEWTNVHLYDGGVRLNSGTNLYASPHEFDLMARIAGLRLRERWGGWSREPFTVESTRHVSVYAPSGAIS